MKYESLSLVAFIGLASTAPAPRNKFSIPMAMLRVREVPQEHSHNRFLDGVRVNLNINNPNKIQDPVFGLLGNAAAAAGAGSITNLDCLHQATADQAFTNAKAANNVTGQADALMYAALERNTGSVGLASVICNETAVNPEIAAVQQHQDPASANAAATNKAIVLALAQQLASIGADPQEALLSGTFAPGTIGDPTGAGHTCDTADDVEGCIFSQNLLVNDATAAEISAAVASGSSSGAASGSASSNSTASVATSSSAASGAKSTGKASAGKGSASSSSSASAAAGACPAASSSAASSSSGSSNSSASSAASASSSSSSSTAATGTNVQTFTGTLGGAAPPVTSSAGTRPFTVNGDTFVNAGAALQRSCSIQNNACANAANSGSLAGTSVADCNAQETACNAAASAKKRAAGANVQTFTGTLGGAAPPVVQSSGARPFSVNGDTFVNKAAALQRSCSVQNTACANAANSGSLAGTSVADCNTQEAACNAAASA